MGDDHRVSQDFVRLSNVSFAYKQAGQKILKGVSLSLSKGELFCLLGPSGCGKSTLLNVIAGFASPHEGDILVDGRKLNDLPPEHREVGFIFQSYGLFPHLNILENVEFGLKMKRVSKPQRRAEAVSSLERVHINCEHYFKSPNELSGGQRQRVALARALALKPKLLVLDEPFSSLDQNLRSHMRQELKRIQRESQTTMILVTHDQEEAMVLGDRISVMENGQMSRPAAPKDLYQNPANETIARFFGEVNILSPAHRESKFRHVSGKALMVRPENVQIISDNANGEKLQVVNQRILGADSMITLKHHAYGEILARVRTESVTYQTGDRVEIYISDAHIRALDS